MHLCLVSLLILFPMFRVLFLWYSILCVRLVVEVEVEILGWTFIAAAVKKKILAILCIYSNQGLNIGHDWMMISLCLLILR